MKLKKLILLLLFSMFCFASFADDSYKLSVISADDMTVSESLVVLEGNVEVKFSTLEDERERNLTAQKVIIDVDNKNLDALGNVYLTEGKDSTFQGESLSLNWDTLDVVVFGGTSSSERSNASGSKVKFYVVGDRISYAGENDSVFFQDGVIGTREKDPYWSVAAKKIGLAGSDIFFSNATLKLGRVPILWIPFFFYPGNRLSFNPAIGVSTDKGKFLNTTYELYGSYPGLGVTGTPDKDAINSDDTSAMTANFLSLLSSDEDSEQIHSGWTYISVEDADELTGIQKWAYETGSYFAIFADAWEKYGLSIGFDTKNYLLNKELTISSDGVLAFRNDEKRYAFDASAAYKHGKVSFDVNIPFLSDPNVKVDLLNRNTVFGLDAAFGSEQTFPNTYSSNMTTYSVVLNGSASHSIKDIQLNLSSLKTKIDYEWDSILEEYKVKNATMPYINLKSSGTIFKIAGQSKTKEETVKLSNKTAQKFYDELQNLPNVEEKTDTQSNTIDGLSLAKGSNVSTTKQVVTEAGSIKMDYSYNQVIDNSYEKEFEHTSFFNKIDVSINTNAKAPGNWFSFSDVMNPVYNKSDNENKPDTTSFKLKNATKFGVDKIGLTYGLTNYLYIFEENDSQTIDRKGEWDDKDVLEHYFSFNKTLGSFKLGLKYVLPPLKQKMTPSVSFAQNGFSASTDITYSMEKEAFFEPTVTHASASYSKDIISVGVSSTYDFEKEDKWDGFKGSQNFSLKLIDKRLTLSEDLSLVKQFEASSMVLKLAFDKSYINYKMKDKELNPDELNIYLYQGVPAFYIWKNRIGFEGNFDFGFTYDFENKYNSSLYADVKFVFAINKFFDLSISAKTVNNSFYRYYTKSNNDEYFDFGLLGKDLVKSFDFFGDGRTSTGFNISSLSLSAVHYMEDWTLTLTSTSHVKTVDGKSKYIPDFTFLVKWDAIPELKSTNSWEATNGWEKK